MRNQSSEESKEETRQYSSVILEPCLNCHLEIGQHDPYCKHCGQKNRRSLPKIKDLLSEGIDELFAVDGRLRQTLKYLFTRPGALTKAWIKGERVRFVSPVKLYFLTSALFFFAFGNVTSSTEDAIIKLRDSQVKEGDFTISWFGEIDGKHVDLSEHIVKTKLGPKQLADSLHYQLESSFDEFGFSQLYKVNRYPELYQAQLVEKFSVFLILFIPVFAMIDYLLFKKIGTGHLVGHIVHIMNEFSIIFITVTVVIIMNSGISLLIDYFPNIEEAKYLLFIPLAIVSFQSYKAYQAVYNGSGFWFALRYLSLQLVFGITFILLFLSYLLVAFIIT